MKRDEQIFNLIQQERERQTNGIELIASENFVSDQVMEAMGSVMTNKYAEGLPGKRYYGGCQIVDQSEELAIARVKELFGCEWANVQPHSGAQANMAVLMACLQPGDTFMGLDLNHGGHLSQLRRPGQHGRPDGLPATGRHLHGPRPQPRRSPVTRLPSQLLRYPLSSCGLPS